MAKSRIVRAFSAGGVVFRIATPADLASQAPQHQQPQKSQISQVRTASDIAMRPAVQVVLVGFPREDTWMLPKGTPIVGESVEETALREVREETGIVPRVVRELGSIEYWFSRKGVRFHKEVFHYLMEAIGGDVSLHDHEYDEARWFPLSEVSSRLTYPNEARITRDAEPFILEYVSRGS